MERKPLKRFAGLIATALVTLLLVGCNGTAGQNGKDGSNGSNGNDGTTPTFVTDAALLTAEQWAGLKVTGTVTSVTMGGAPVVNFELKDAAGNGIKGFGNFTSKSSTALVPSYPNLAFAIAKLIPEDATTGAPSKWVSYIVESMPTTTTAKAPTRPTTDNTGTLVDKGNGSYTYTFYRDITKTQAFLDGYTYTGANVKADLGDVTYEPTRTHRLSIQVSGNMRGTGSNTANGVTVATAVPMENPINISYDFVPATGAAAPAQREIAAIAKCNECHDKLAFHGGGRVELQYCNVCHTDQRKYGYAEAAAGTTTTYTGETRKINGGAAGDMTAMAHRIHMGTNLTKTGYSYAGVYFEKLGYSMLDGGQRMCSKCHSGSGSNATAQGENWNTKPSRMACGSCHDAVNFATGAVGATPAAHVIQTDDKACAGCHTPSDIKVAHYTTNLTPNNPVTLAGLHNFTYQISSATQATAGGAVTVKFRILTDGGVAGATPTPVTFLPAAAGMANPLTNFTGSPSFLLAWAAPQAGETTTPADYNNLLNTGVPSASNFQPRSVSIAALLDTAKATTDGTLTGPDANGYYTANIVGASRVFPTGATMRAVALQGYFTQVGTFSRGGTLAPLVNPARHTVATWLKVGTDAVRRTAVDSNKCGSCHEWFEGHGGNRVKDVQVCVMCHVPGLTTSGRGMTDAALSTYYNAGLFTADQKTALTAWTGISFATNPVTAGNVNVALNFPQVTNNMKDMIHGIHAGKDRTTNPFKIVRDRTPSAVNVIDGTKIGYPGILANCQGCHTYNGITVPANTLASRDEAINVAGNTTTALAKAALATVNATDKMTTPFTAACVSCHDSVAAAAHMTLNGGQIMVARSALKNTGESCAVCHGVGSTYDPAKIHK